MTVRLGVPSKGRLMDKTFDWFAARGIGLSRSGDAREYAGRVEGVESVELPEGLAHLHSRNNQLAWLGLQQDGMLDSIAAMKEQVGPDRIGIVMGTSTSSIGRTEEAYRQLLPSDAMPPEYCQPQVHNLHSPGIFVQAVTGINGPSLTISTACSSSAKVFASAARWINHGLVDAVARAGGLHGDLLAQAVEADLLGIDAVEEYLSLARVVEARQQVDQVGQQRAVGAMGRGVVRLAHRHRLRHHRHHPQGPRTRHRHETLHVHGHTQGRQEALR